MQPLANDVFFNKIVIHLGLIDYQSLSWTCKALNDKLKNKKQMCLHLQRIHKHLRIKLDQYSFEETTLDKMHADGNFVIAGSALLAWVNYETWKPKNVNVWVQEYGSQAGAPPNTPLMRELAQGNIDVLYRNRLPWISDQQQSAFRSRFCFAKSKTFHSEEDEFFILNIVTGTTNDGHRIQKWGEFVINLFDADFLHMYYTGKQLSLRDVPSMVERCSPLRNKMDDCKDSLETRLEKYAGRNFQMIV